MPANNRRRKIRDNVVGRFLVKETGGANERGSAQRRAIKAASEFHEMPHMFKAAPDISEFISPHSKTMHLKSVIERNALDEFLDCSLSSQAAYDKQNTVRIIVRQSDQQMKNDEQPNAISQYSDSLWQRIIPIPRRPINYVSGKPETILSPTELSELESETFLKWRLTLSKIEEEEGRIMTPFERNLEFWRQLWRVLERSDVVMQILDARNPLFFRSKDLEQYVKEIHEDKNVILLMNKSDLVSHAIRQAWAQWFREHGVVCLFFSALDELKRQGAVPKSHGVEEVDQEEKREASDDESSTSSSDENNIDRFDSINDSSYSNQSSLGNEESSSSGSYRNMESVEMNPNEEENHMDLKRNDNMNWNEDLKRNRNEKLNEDEDCRKVLDGEQFEEYLWRISSNAFVLNGSQLLSVMLGIRQIALSKKKINMKVDTVLISENVQSKDKEDDERNSSKSDGQISLDDSKKKIFMMRRDPSTFIIGLVGYPNVGKSSVINSLLGHKAVSVSRQPGKTKHFQTIPFPTMGITLCDCPGLVFPQIVSTKAHLVTNGVSSIDSVRGNFVAPIQIICDLIPYTLIQQYNLTHQFTFSRSKKTQVAQTRQLVPQHHSYGPEPLPLGQRLDASKFLVQLATSRGYISGGKGGLPDLFQTAKFVLRDFTIGKLIHWILPPDSDVSKQRNISVPTTTSSISKVSVQLNSVFAPSHEPIEQDDMLLDLLTDSSSTIVNTTQKLSKRGLRQIQKQMMKGKGKACITNSHQISKSLRGLASTRILNK